MYKTIYGNFDGNTWEALCQICFKLKYQDEGYQQMPAWQGDLGIEGFTRTGRVFQCYCPDENYNPDKLYDKQRDKITVDLEKLVTYEVQLKDYLKDIKIKEWLFVTPDYHKKDIVKHCRDKAIEYKSKNLSILDTNFDVLIYNIDFFATELQVALTNNGKKLIINPVDETSDDEIADWKSKQIPLVDNALRKHSHRILETVTKRDLRINSLAQNTVANFLDGNIAVKTLQEKFPNDYEKFIRVVSLFEKKVTDMCNTNSGNANGLYKEIELELKNRLKESFSYIDQVTIDILTEQVLADWVLRCPIDFE